jgi:hypothetical protein
VDPTAGKQNTQTAVQNLKISLDLAYSD